MDNLWFGTEALRRMIYFTLAILWSSHKVVRKGRDWGSRRKGGENSKIIQRTVSASYVPGSWVILLLQQP